MSAIDMDDESRHASHMIWLLVSLVVVFIAWASYFEIDQTVHSTGQVILSARTQVVQTADGGVLKQLHTREGQAVKAGQLLAVLEKERAQAGLDESLARLMALKAAQVRAKAEIAQQDPVYGPEFNDFPEFVQAQTGLHFQKKQTLEEEIHLSMDAMRMAEAEKSMNENLLRTGDGSELDVLRAKRQVTELQSRITATKNKYLQDARAELTRIEDELASQAQRRNGAESVLSHTDVKAPMDGIVKSVKIFTLGGVLRPGDELMQIAPVGDAVFIEAKIQPADVAQLVPGQPVSVSLDSFDVSVYGSLQGELVDISPDSLSENTLAGMPAVHPLTGQPLVYYKVNIKIAKEQVNPKSGLIEIKPGMTAGIEIKTGTRSLMTYLLKPVIKTLNGSLKER